MISTNQLKNGMVIKLEGALYSVTWFQHHKPGKGGAFVRTKLKNLRLGTVLERTFRAGELLEDVFIQEKKFQYLYSSGDDFTFMDAETYEQVAFDRSQLKGTMDLLKENMEVTALLDKHNIIGIKLPIFVDLKVTYTEPGIRGNTAKSSTKPAKLETGATIQVPLFVDIGDMIRIDTRTRQYVSRV